MLWRLRSGGEDGGEGVGYASRFGLSALFLSRVSTLG